MRRFLPLLVSAGQLATNSVSQLYQALACLKIWRSLLVLDNSSANIDPLQANQSAWLLPPLCQAVHLPAWTSAIVACPLTFLIKMPSPPRSSTLHQIMCHRSTAGLLALQHQLAPFWKPSTTPALSHQIVIGGQACLRTCRTAHSSARREVAKKPGHVP